MIVGGLHLSAPEVADRIAPTIEFLTDCVCPQPAVEPPARCLCQRLKYIVPLHCTGFAARVALERVMGEECVVAGIGLNIVVKGGTDPVVDG